MIAQQPSPTRDESRLLIVDRATGELQHRAFRDLPSLLLATDCLVMNTTRVIPAKFVARRRTGGRVEGLFLRELEQGRWLVMLSNIKRLRPDERLQLGSTDWRLVFKARLERGVCEVGIEPTASAAKVLAEAGEAPLPPYIHRDEEASEDLGRQDSERYQTVYAKQPGAVAAPTAGLHFTESVLDEIHRKGIAMAGVVLHVGLGTFQPVEVEQLSEHRMHSEWFDLPELSAETIRRTRTGGGRVVAVGTTSVRVLETCSRGDTLHPQQGWTDLLIYPPYTFRSTDVLLTNFHLPGSTLLALVFAFAGRDLILSAYREAVRERYRFYSYGDAMLIV